MTKERPYTNHDGLLRRWMIAAGRESSPPLPGFKKTGQPAASSAQAKGPMHSHAIVIWKDP